MAFVWTHASTHSLPTAAVTLCSCGLLGDNLDRILFGGPAQVVHCSSDEIGLVNHVIGLPAGDTDEDAFVQPLQIGGGGLDLG